jgi:hypothetical protein
MIQLALTIADVGEDQTMYTLQYGKRMEEFTVNPDLMNMSVIERQNTIIRMLMHLFQEEREEWLNTRPRDTPEGEMLQDLFEQIRRKQEELGMEDDDEEDDEE